MKFFFNDSSSIKTALSVIATLLFICYNLIKRHEINNWGIRILILFIIGLYACVYAATRDGFHLTVQNAIDGSTTRGLFTLTSLQTIISGILGAVIVISCIISLFVNKQGFRQIMFFVISGSISLKILLIEISRIALYLSNSTIWSNK